MFCTESVRGVSTLTLKVSKREAHCQCKFCTVYVLWICSTSTCTQGTKSNFHKRDCWHAPPKRRMGGGYRAGGRHVRVAQDLVGLPPLNILSPEQRHAHRTAVAGVRSLALACRGEYSRHGGVHRATEKPMGSFLVIPVEERRVPVAEGFRLHLERAAGLTFPPEPRREALAGGAPERRGVCRGNTSAGVGDERQ